MFFLELSCFFYSSAFSKSSLNIWKFTVHIQLKPSLENFEHYFASMWDECNCAVVWTVFGIPFLWNRMKTDLFLSAVLMSYGHSWICQICWCIISCSLWTIFQARILEQVKWLFPSPEDLPNQGIEPKSPALQADSLPAEPQGKPLDILAIWILPIHEHISFHFACLLHFLPSVS